MSAISFYVRGVPKGQPRPRAFAVGGSARVYDPGTAEGWKSEIAVAARPHLPATPLDCAIRLDLEFRFPRPKGHFRGKAQTLRVDAPHYHLRTPDCDNAVKAVCDALTTLGMWKDDSLVAELVARKIYSELPGVAVRVIPIAELEG